MNKPLTTENEWTFELVDAYYHELDRIATEKFGLSYYPNQIEIISSEQMLDAYCITPDHKVLRNDLRWIEAGDVQVGDELLGFDEEGPFRAFKKATVQRVEFDVEEVYEVKMSTGQTFKVTKEHLWLVRQQKGDASVLVWRRTDQLRGIDDVSGYGPSRIPKVISMWNEDTSKDAGWVAGMYDGEGNILKGSLQKLSISQRPGKVLDRMEKILTENNVTYRIYNKHKSDCKTLDIVGPVKDKLDFLGTYRPERLIATLDFDKLGLMKTSNWEEVESIIPIGKRKIIKITTSTGTFVCEGYPMHNCTVGMPIGYSHWSFGKQFVDEQEHYKRGRMGLAYEIVINSNPCISYNMEENSMMMIILVMAHAAMGHNSFFKNNYLFKQWTDAEAIIDYLAFAKKFIADCEEKYGAEEVEEILDSCHALQQYGVDKYKRSSPLSARKEEERKKEREEYLEKSLNDIWRTVPVTEKSTVEEEERFPSEPQENILYFIEKNAPNMATWKREIIRIVRKLAQYFYPQIQTKVMNEGWACFWHYTLTHELYAEGLINQGFMLEFYQSHTNVVRQLPYDHPHYNGINPYALGFNMFQDIKRIAVNPTEEDRNWFGDQWWVGCGDWNKAIHWAMENFKDESFIKQFLSPSLIREFRLFSILDDDHDPKMEVSAIHEDVGYRHVRDALSEQYNIGYQIPDIQIYNVDRWGDRSLTLRHFMVNRRPLDEQDTTEVLKHLYHLWGYGVRLESVDVDNRIRAAYEVSESESLLDVFLDDDD